MKLSYREQLQYWWDKIETTKIKAKREGYKRKLDKLVEKERIKNFIKAEKKKYKL